ncbi:bifunctional lysylphosphatidylglycerol flippase/synthetase MprF [Aureimonas leprariae]|uniref:Phosphatidylglycerol lysyltransferase n=1 Tax=Plantimonas leprariae TaxID=2615207 RepID=A0A7V7TWQ1_9HYPH|nr:bifunctional lysylphosphatidylglycerol flippase/synthetase MprF [Aureimonas leprariae]KAB0680055.1 bifunctional lysylphosphatidylglycerol flippase/synthetase MprF [Aureimonas leprariae]
MGAGEDVAEAGESWFSRNRRLINLAAMLLVLAAVGIAISRLTSEVRYEDILAAWSDTGWPTLIGAVLLTGLSFAALTFYDFGALTYVGHRPPLPTVAVTAFCAYAVGNTAGFGPLSGGAIRYRAYSRLGLTPEEIAKVIAFVTLAFGLGLAGVAAVSLLVMAEGIAPLVHVDALALRLIGLAILVPLVALPFAGRLGGETRFGRLSRIALRMPRPAAVGRQFLVTALDVMASAGVLYVLLPPDANIDYPSFLGVYSVAVALGVLSHVPAGLGVFETVIVAALGRQIDVDQVLGALVLYRIVYHILPLALASLLVSVIELQRAATSPVGRAIRVTGGRLVPPILATLSLTLGAMLIFSAVTPTPAENLAYLAAFVPLPFVEGAHFIASLLGLFLIVISRGLAQRLDGAWWAAVGASLAALALSLLKAVALVEAGFLVFFALALLASRGEFTRSASLLRQALTPAWILALATVVIGAIVVLFFVYRDVDYSNELWWQFTFESEAPRSLRAALGFTILASCIAIWSLLRPALTRAGPPISEALAMAAAIVGEQDAADGNLVRMGDKNVLLSADGKAFIMYARQNRSFVALFDPIGDREAWPELIWQFVEMARTEGCRAVFYQVSPEALALYADAGLQAYKLGEIASVDLAEFHLTGGKRAALRQSMTRGSRDGLTFEFVEPAGLPPLMDDLASVSDAWLEQHNTREKGFSLGGFDPDYILSQPAAVLRLHGRIVAFANVLLTDTRQEGSIDLMRFSPDAPKGSMDFLFLKLMEHLKAEGFRTFNLGMAPLSGMSERQIAPIWNRVGRTVFEHGERFYNFRGLRAFKAKFHPTWAPRYLAVSGGINPVFALMDATLLIGGGLKGVLAK